MTFGDVLQAVSRPAKLRNAEQYQLVTAKRGRGGIVLRGIKSGQDIKTKTQFYVKKGDFLISRRQIVHGGCGVVPQELDNAVVSNEYLVLHPKAGLREDYLRWLSHSVYFQQTCFHASLGVHIEKMVFAPEKWFRFQLYLPPENEQKRIAELLGVWDQAILKTSKLIEARREFKSGLMQQLLTGKRRLPGFKERWKKVALGKMGQCVSGGTPQTGNSACWNGEVMWCTPSDISILESKYISSTPRTITAQGLRDSSAVLLPPKSLIVCTRASVGDCALNTVPMATNQGFKNLIPKKEYSPEFLYYLVCQEKNRFIRYSAGSTFLELSKKDFVKLAFGIPPLPEQLRIASVLSAVDAQIECLGRKTNRLIEQKRGLIQNLLTGRVRVKV